MITKAHIGEFDHEKPKKAVDRNASYGCGQRYML